MKKILVVGAGASGLFAAGRAASLGAQVRLLEKMKYPGLKLRITGKGKCNLTNIAPLERFLDQFGREGRFLRSAFQVFFAPELMAFLEKLGIPLEVQRGGRVFPASGGAPDLVKALVDWNISEGVRLEPSTEVESLLLRGKQVEGVKTRDGRIINADSVILCMGGASYPATGSDGSGFRIASSTGHTVTRIRPALVPLDIANFPCGSAAGLQLHNVDLSMYVDGRKKRSEFGEVMFTDSGMTGAALLRLSGAAVDELEQGRNVDLSIDFKPALSERKLDGRLLRDLDSRGSESLAGILRGLLPAELIPICLDLNGLPSDKRGNQVTADQRRRIRNWLKDFRMQVAGPRPMGEAIVTAGGVDLREIDPRTMESKLVERLFISGEMLNLQANTGGYNLQAAFSTGWLAGESAASG